MFDAGFSSLQGSRLQMRIAFPICVALCTGVSLPAVAKTSCGDQVQVRANDTLFSIAERCDTSVAALRRANPEIDPRDMRIGLYLHLPGGAAPEPAPSSRTYTFRPGDTLYSIAEVLGVDVDAVLEANPELDPTDISIGSIINLPGADQPDLPSGPSASVSISPDQGSVGTRVSIDASGFPPEASVKIGGGPPNSEYTVLQEMLAGTDGWVRTVVRLPEYASDNDRWVFVVATQDNRVKAVSEPFEISSREGDGESGRRITGTLTREGVECPALRGDDGNLYTLAGETGRFDPGDRVTVRGSVAQVSICQQGTTIDVESIRAAD